jgi:hypothetical protein
MPLITGTTAIGATATANVDISYQFFTQGPARQGVVTLQPFGMGTQAGPGNDRAVVNLVVGTYAGSCINNQCGGILGLSHAFPFTLGNTFNFNLSENFFAGADFTDGPGFASGRIGLTVQLFEANGKTPVNIYVAPEPGTLALLLVSFGGLGATCGIRSVITVFRRQTRFQPTQHTLE